MAIDAVLAGLVAAWRWGWGPAAAVVFGAFFLHRPRLLRRQRAQDPLGRLVPARWSPPPSPTSWSPGAAAGACCGTSSTPAQPAVAAFIDRARPGADPGPRHGGVHDRQSRGRADGAAAQHRAQPGPARAGRADDRAHAGHPARPGGASGSRSRRSAQGFFRVIVSYGFMDQPDVPRALELCQAARPAGRPGADLVLHRPRDADPDAQPADGAGRGARVHVPLRRQPVGDRLLRDPAGAGRGARDPARGLTRTWIGGRRDFYLRYIITLLAIWRAGNVIHASTIARRRAAEASSRPDGGGRRSVPDDRCLDLHGLPQAGRFIRSFSGMGHRARALEPRSRSRLSPTGSSALGSMSPRCRR